MSKRILIQTTTRPTAADVLKKLNKDQQRILRSTR